MATVAESHMKQGDTTRKRMFVTAGPGAQGLSGASIVLKFSNGVEITAPDLVIEDVATGEISFPREPMNAVEAAPYPVEAEITFADGSKQTWPDDRNRPVLHVHRTL